MAGNARISQLPVEILYQGDGNARVSHLPLEILIQTVNTRTRTATADMYLRLVGEGRPVYGNAAQAQLARDHTSIETVIDLATGQGAVIPDVPDAAHYVELAYTGTDGRTEVMLVLSKTGDQINVVRGRQNTTPQGLTQNGKLTVTATADAIQRAVRAIQSPFAALVRPSGTGTPTDYFDTTTLDPAWVWVNQGGATSGVQDGALWLTAPVIASGTSLRCLVQPFTGSVWTFTTRLALNATPTNYVNAGLVWRNSSTGAVETFRMQYNGFYVYASGKYASVTSFTSDYASLAGWRAGPNPWFRVVCDGTNISTYFSRHREYWQLVETHTVASNFGGGAPNQIGLFAESGNTTYEATGVFDCLIREV